MLLDYNLAYYTLQDLRDAEVKTQSIIGHADIESRLEMMTNCNLNEILWFDLSDCERDLIRYFCGIAPHFRQPVATATCPICNAVLHCPCHECRKTEPAGAKHYLFSGGRNNRDDLICCPDCGFSGPIQKWKMGGKN